MTGLEQMLVVGMPYRLKLHRRPSLKGPGRG
jgi:hypothetical protein